MKTITVSTAKNFKGLGSIRAKSENGKAIHTELPEWTSLSFVVSELQKLSTEPLGKIKIEGEIKSK